MVFHETNVLLNVLKYERRIGRAGCCGGFVAQWLWRLQSDTLGSSPAVAVFFSSPFSSSRLSSNEISIKLMFVVGASCVQPFTFHL